MHRAAFTKAMRAREAVADPKAGALRYRRAQHRLHALLPNPARRERPPIESEIVGDRADNAKALDAVAERKGNHAPDEPVLRQRLRRGERDVPRRRIEMEDSGENQLDRAALGADDEIDAFRIAGEALA